MSHMRIPNIETMIKPFRLDPWGDHWVGFHEDTCHNQAPVLLRLRRVPGVDNSYDGWAVLALQIHNTKNHEVDRLDVLRARFHMSCFSVWSSVS